MAYYNGAPFNGALYIYIYIYNGAPFNGAPFNGALYNGAPCNAALDSVNKTLFDRDSPLRPSRVLR